MARSRSGRARPREDASRQLDVFSDELKPFGIVPDDLVFNRDCLEVTIDFGDRRELVLYHLQFRATSMTTGGQPRPADPAGRGSGRRAASSSDGSATIGARPNWIIAGDLNDFASASCPAARPNRSSPAASTALRRISPSTRWVFCRRGERWTSISTRLAVGTAALAGRSSTCSSTTCFCRPRSPPRTRSRRSKCIRRGLPYRVPLDPAAPDRSIAYLSTRADRYPRMGWDRPKASDHCPLVVEIDLPETRRGSRRTK